MEKLSCKSLYNQYNEFFKSQLDKSENIPKLFTLRVGDDLGAISYEKSLRKHCEKIGLSIESVVLEENVDKNTIINYINDANQNDQINSILVFQPLLGYYNKDEIIEKINPRKDVDGVTMSNRKKLLDLKDKTNTPATANAIHLFIKSEMPDITGKNVLIINRSHVIGIPLFFLLLKDNATVTVAHSKSENLEKLMEDKDIIVSAVGKSEIFKPSKLKEGSMIIDMGISQNENGEYTGDFSTDSLVDKNVSYLPSIGGIGKITRSIIIEHTLINYLGEEHGR